MIHMIRYIRRKYLTAKRKMLKKYYTWRITLQAGSVGSGLKVNRKSSVSNNVFLKDNVNFNGMNIAGGGQGLYRK